MLSDSDRMERPIFRMHSLSPANGCEQEGNLASLSLVGCKERDSCNRLEQGEERRLYRGSDQKNKTNITPKPFAPHLPLPPPFLPSSHPNPVVLSTANCSAWLVGCIYAILTNTSLLMDFPNVRGLQTPSIRVLQKFRGANTVMTVQLCKNVTKISPSNSDSGAVSSIISEGF